MSEKKLEECSLEESTHVEVNGNVHLLENDKIALEYYHGKCIGIRWWDTDAFIPEQLFSTLGIKPMREKKREPRECMALTVIAQRNGKDVVALLPTDDFKLGMTVRCVEILKEEE